MNLKLPDEETVMELHDIVLLTSGGKPGVHDAKLIKSAIERPQTHIQYIDSYDINTICALLVDSIARNHGFRDGNKRTALITAIFTYRINGIHFNATEEMNEAFDNLIMDVVLKKPTIDRLVDELVVLRQEYETTASSNPSFFQAIKNLRKEKG